MEGQESKKIGRKIWKGGGEKEKVRERKMKK